MFNLEIVFENMVIYHYLSLDLGLIRSVLSCEYVRWKLYKRKWIFTQYCPLVTADKGFSDFKILTYSRNTSEIYKKGQTIQGLIINETLTCLSDLHTLFASRFYNLSFPIRCCYSYASEKM